jgi:hypothetical protein
MKSGCSMLSMDAWIGRIDSKRTGRSRMFLALLSRAQDDALAEQIAQNVIIVFELFSGPVILAWEVIRLPFRSCSPRRSVLKYDQPAKTAIANKTTDIWPGILTSEIVQCSYVNDELLGLGWALLPYVMREQWLHDALSFYSTSVFASFQRAFFKASVFYERKNCRNSPLIVFGRSSNVSWNAL